MLIFIVFLLTILKKLVPNFFDKEKYVLHCGNLQLYLRLELKLKKIHRVGEFSQSQWLKPYVEINTRKRIETENMKIMMEMCCAD